MKLETALIGLVSILLCILPFVLMERKRKNKEKKLLDHLKLIAGGYNLGLAAYDCGARFAIGLADNKQYVFFFQEKNDETKIQLCIPLETIRNCSVSITKRTVKTKEEIVNVIDRLELLLEPKDKNKDPSKFEFFNTDETVILNDELALINKWKSLIAQNLKA